MEKFEILKKDLKYKGSLLDVYDYELKTPAGNITNWDIMQHSGGAAILPIDKDNNIILIRQYRGGADDLLYEIPAGKKDDPHEKFEECAKRELEEEIGYKANSIKYLMTFKPAPAYSCEVTEIFFASDLIKTRQSLDENEFVEIRKFKIKEALEMIGQGLICDGKTIAAISYYNSITNS